MFFSRSGKTSHQIGGRPARNACSGEVAIGGPDIRLDAARWRSTWASLIDPFRLATASFNAISLSANTGVNAATGMTVISASNPSMIASNSGRLKPSSMRRLGLDPEFFHACRVRDRAQ